MTTLDDRVGLDLPDRIAAAIAQRGPAFVNGLLLDGTAARLGFKAGLAPFMTLPPAEAQRLTRARMAELIARRVSATDSITRDELLGGGFTEAEIARHFTAAKRIARVDRMAA